MREKGLNVSDIHTNYVVPILDYLGFAIWHEQRDGLYNENAGFVYENTRRLARPGQQHFRLEALTLWKGRCAISEFSVGVALEAAHVIPHSQKGKMVSENATLLRVDLHRLFDFGLLAIDPEDLSVHLNGKARDSYQAIAGNKVTLPKGGPSAKAFEKRWNAFNSIQDV